MFLISYRFPYFKIKRKRYKVHSACSCDPIKTENHAVQLLSSTNFQAFTPYFYLEALWLKGRHFEGKTFRLRSPYKAFRLLFSEPCINARICLQATFTRKKYNTHYGWNCLKVCAEHWFTNSAVDVCIKCFNIPLLKVDTSVGYSPLPPQTTPLYLHLTYLMMGVCFNHPSPTSIMWQLVPCLWIVATSSHVTLPNDRDLSKMRLIRECSDVASFCVFSRHVVLGTHTGTSPDCLLMAVYLAR